MASTVPTNVQPVAWARASQKTLLPKNVSRSPSDAPTVSADITA
jgi:hypothetical protein